MYHDNFGSLSLILKMLLNITTIRSFRLDTLLVKIVVIVTVVCSYLVAEDRDPYSNVYSKKPCPPWDKDAPLLAVLRCEGSQGYPRSIGRQWYLITASLPYLLPYSASLTFHFVSDQDFFRLKSYVWRSTSPQCIRIRCRQTPRIFQNVYNMTDKGIRCFIANIIFHLFSVLLNAILKPKELRSQLCFEFQNMNQ